MFHKKDYTNLKLKLIIANCGVRTEFVTPPSFFEKEIKRRKRNLRYEEILVVLFWKVKLFCKDISPPSPKNNYKFLLFFLEILMIYKTSFAVMNKRKLKILQKNEIINNIWLKNSYRKKNLYKNMSWFKKSES